MLVHLILSRRSLRLSLVLFILFILFCSSEVISSILSSSSLICCSASDILLVIPSRVFLISVSVLFVSAYLFFNSSRSLLIYLYIFSIFFNVFDHLHYHYAELFFRYFAYFLFIYLDFCVSSFLFIFVVFLCLIIIFFNLLFLRSPCPSLQGGILSSFWFLLPLRLVQWFV